MATLQTERPIPRHSHKPNGLATDAQCPYCGHPISRKQFREIQSRIEAEEKARLAKLEKALAEKTTAEIHKAKLRAAELAEQHIKKVQAEREADKLQHVAEKLRLETALAELQRKVAAKPAHQIGEPAEVDLFETLTAAFPADRISRVSKGVKGPDVIVEVVSDGAVVGSIILDSKNHKAWQNKFTSKLRGDQLAANADFAILSTSVFPSGQQQLHIQDRVIVADPARVVVLVDLLRHQIISNHTLRLSADARNEKADALYAFILSPAYADMLDRLLSRLAELDALHADEVKAHERTFAKRIVHMEAIRATVREFTAAVAQIIAGDIL